MASVNGIAGWWRRRCERRDAADLQRMERVCIEQARVTTHEDTREALRIMAERYRTTAGTTFIECSPDDISCTVSPDGKSITFHPCGLTSHLPYDVEKRYCAGCHRWMELIELAREMKEEFR